MRLWTATESNIDGGCYLVVTWLQQFLSGITSVVLALAGLPAVGVFQNTSGYTESLSSAEACVAAPLDIASFFNVFVLGDLKQSGASTEGRVAVGGDAHLTDYSVGSALRPDPAPRNVLVVDESLTFKRGAVAGGNAVSGESAAIDHVSFAPGGDHHHGQKLDFDAVSVRLRDTSTAYARLVANGTVRAEYGRVSLSGTDPLLNVFDVSDSLLTGTTSVTMNVSSGSTVLVNVGGENPELHNMGFALAGVDPSRVLYNFPDATALTIEGIGVEGSVLAPNADVSFNNAIITGTLVGASLSGSGQANRMPFTGCLPSTSSTPLEQYHPPPVGPFY
jgi:choice-of-anchor A domain-containing protein